MRGMNCEIQTFVYKQRNGYFNFSEDIDLHKLDPNKPIVFDNIWVNPNHLVFIEKMEEGEEK